MRTELHCLRPMYLPLRLAISPPLLPPGTSHAALPFAALRQLIGAQPTLALLPSGELPASWGRPHQQGTKAQGLEWQTLHGRGRRPSLSVTMVRMALGAGDTLPGDDEEGNGERMEAESSTGVKHIHERRPHEDAACLSGWRRSQQSLCPTKTCVTQRRSPCISLTHAQTSN